MRLLFGQPKMNGFADYPKTLGELRAAKRGGSDAWAPRDVLLTLLREIDAGECAPKTLCVVYATAEEAVEWAVSGSSRLTIVGMLAEAIVGLSAPSVPLERSS